MANKNICQKLQQARKAAGLSQRDVYNWLGVSQSTFSSWETGKSEPSIDVFLRICAKYGIDNISEYFASDSLKRHRVLDLCAISKLTGLDDAGRAAVYNCLNYEYDAMRLRQGSSRRRLPVYTHLSPMASDRLFCTSDCFEIELDAPDNADAAVCITDTSMEPVLCKGEIKFIKYTPRLSGDEIGLFILNGTIYCRRLDYRGDDILLTAVNTDYSSLRISLRDSLAVIGRVLL